MVKATVAEINIKDIVQSLRTDAFDDNHQLDSREWQHIVDNLSIGHFSINDLLVEDVTGTGKLGILAIDGFKMVPLKVPACWHRRQCKQPRSQPKHAAG